MLEKLQHDTFQYFLREVNPANGLVKDTTRYFENSRRATYAQREYAIHNPYRFKGYQENCWGITASDGPGPARRIVDGLERYFYGYAARGIVEGLLEPARYN